MVYEIRGLSDELEDQLVRRGSLEVSLYARKVRGAVHPIQKTYLFLLMSTRLTPLLWVSKSTVQLQSAE